MARNYIFYRPQNAPPSDGGTIITLEGERNVVIASPGSSVDNDPGTKASLNRLASNIPEDIIVPVTYSFADPLSDSFLNKVSTLNPFKITKVSFKKYRTNSGTVTLNGVTKSWNNSEDDVYVDVDYNIDIINPEDFDNSLELVLISTGDYSFSSALYDVKIYGYFKEKSFEFNDSVLSTKGWNSTRYEGKQLKASEINQYSNGDVTYGNTPVVSNFCRTFYIANDVISLSKTSSVDDPLAPYIPDFSNILIDKAITVNDDFSTIVVDVDNFPQNKTGEIKKRGFDREFQDNFSIGSEVGLRIIDSNSPKKQANSYTVYLNGGKLEQIVRYALTPSTVDENNFTYTLNSNNFSCIRSSAVEVGRFSIDNEFVVRRFFTGSVGLKGGKADVQSFFSNLQSYMGGEPNERFYVTLTTASFGVEDLYYTPINTNEERNGNYRTDNLAQISTFEIQSISNPSLGIIKASSKTPLNQDYSAGESVVDVNPESFDTGSLIINYLNQEKPCLLLNLNKELELPQAGGSKPIVVIPENLHPFIKTNIIHFLAKSGLDIGNITTVPSLDNTYINLP